MLNGAFTATFTGRALIGRSALRMTEFPTDLWRPIPMILPLFWLKKAKKSPVHKNLIVFSEEIKKHYGNSFKDVLYYLDERNPSDGGNKNET